MSHPEPHPEPEALAAYHAGELTEPEERRLQDHLVSCPECAALLLDLDGLSDPAFGAGSLAPADQEALWRSLQAEIRKEEAPVSLAPVVPLRRRILSPPWLPALAAALLVATIGLSVWVVSLRRTIDTLSRPQAVSVLNLDADTARGEGSRLPTISRDVQSGALILSPPGQRSTRYRVVIERAGGAKVLSSGWLAPNAFGSLSVSVSRYSLGPGEYRVRLLEESGSQIAEYPLRVE